MVKLVLHDPVAIEVLDRLKEKSKQLGREVSRSRIVEEILIEFGKIYESRLDNELVSRGKKKREIGKEDWEKLALMLGQVELV